MGVQHNSLTSKSIRASSRFVASDRDLVRNTLNGDSSAFSALFERHKAKVYSVCLRMTNDPAMSEDLVQDTFLHAFRKLAQFRGQAALSTWLYRITVNVVLMQFRKTTVRHVSCDVPDSDLAQGIQHEFASSDKRLAACGDRIDLVRALQELPDGYRTIYLLHDVVGYEHHEISKLLACSAGNSKSQLHKAKHRIREILQRTANPQPAK